MTRLLYVLIGLAIVYVAYRTYRYTTLAEGLDAKLGAGAVILDVRTEKEYRTGHIQEAVNISLGELRKRYTELDPSKTYITTCSHGLRSVKAQSLLKERGFSRVYNGGAWADLEKIVIELGK